MGFDLKPVLHLLFVFIQEAFVCNVPFSLEVLERLVDLQGHTSNDNPVVQEMYVHADWVWICMSYPFRVDCMGFDYPVVLPSDFILFLYSLPGWFRSTGLDTVTCVSCHIMFLKDILK